MTRVGGGDDGKALIKLTSEVESWMSAPLHLEPAIPLSTTR